MAHIHVNCTEEELAEFTELARASQTSVSALGQRAIQQLMVAARTGAAPMVSPSSVRTAETSDEHFVGFPSFPGRRG
jgi:hypothetical protein